MQELSRRNFVTLTGSGVAAIAFGSPLLTKSVEAASMPDAQMKAVIDELTSFNAPPIEKLSPMNARNTPPVADAVMGVLARPSKGAVEITLERLVSESWRASLKTAFSICLNFCFQWLSFGGVKS